MRGAFEMAIHCHEIGTAESGIAHGRQKCSIAEIFPDYFFTNILAMIDILLASVYNDFQ
jgi:hypothetical protein